MAEVARISSKGQIVIPSGIREDLGMDVGTSVVVARMKDFVLLKKINIPNIKEEFEKLTKWGTEFAKKKGIKSEEEVLRIIHKGRGIKSG